MLLDSTDKRPLAVLLCGVPGSGKTTFKRQHLSDIPAISADSFIMRLSREDGVTYSEGFEKHKARATDMYYEALALYLGAFRPVVLDRVHLNVANREKPLKFIGNSHRKVAVYFPVEPLETLVQRIETRALTTGQGVPAEVVAAMLEAYTIPTLEEGFDAVLNAKDFIV